jgi:hypothetical protein
MTGTAGSLWIVLDPAGEPFQVGKSIGGGVELPDGRESVSDTFTVPAAKRLVVQHLSGRITLPAGQSPRLASLFTTVGLDRQAHVLPFRRLVAAPFGDIWFFGGALTLYAEGTEPVLVNVVRNDASGRGFFNWALSGYLVDV